MRILYVNHDNPSPSGGVRVIYRHVELLAHHGLPAFVVHQRADFAPGWFRSDAPCLFLERDSRVTADDIVVLPEDHGAAINGFAGTPLRKVVFCQNHYYVFAGLGDRVSWNDAGISEAMACSEVIADFLRQELAWNAVEVVHNAVDSERFAPRPKKLQIAYMSRKRPAEAHFLHQLYRRRFGDLPWVPIEGVDESRAAELLGESAIFLSLSFREGLGLPPLEAMSAGCLVVGFHGGGGAEYATAANGYWCDEGDLVGCVRTLGRSVELVRSRDREASDRIETGRATAARYSATRQEEELLRFWKRLVG